MKRIGRLVISLFLICALLSGCFGEDTSSHASKKDPFAKELNSFTQRQIVMLNESYPTPKNNDWYTGASWMRFSKLYLENKYMDYGLYFNSYQSVSLEQSYFKYIVKDMNVYVQRVKLLFSLKEISPDVSTLQKEGKYYVREITLLMVGKDEKCYICGYFSEPVSAFTFDFVQSYLKGDSRFAKDLYSQNPMTEAGIEELSFAQLGKDVRQIAVIKDNIIAYITEQDDEKPCFTLNIQNTDTNEQIFTQTFEGEMLGSIKREGEGVAVFVRKAPNASYSKPQYKKTIDLKGNIKEEMAFEAQENTEYLLNDGNILLQRDGSIYYKDSKTGKEKLLLRGKDSEDPVQCTGYVIKQILDNNVLTYTEYGWEWVQSCGYYNLKTQKNHIISPDGQSMYIFDRVNNFLYTRPDDGGIIIADPFKENEFYVTDMTTHVTKKLFDKPLGLPDSIKDSPCSEAFLFHEQQKMLFVCDWELYIVDIPTCKMEGKIPIYYNYTHEDDVFDLRFDLVNEESVYMYLTDSSRESDRQIYYKLTLK